MKKSYKLTLMLLAVICFTATEIVAQPARRPQVISPVVNADKTVTFRFAARNAKKVELSTQFVKGAQPMTKDTSGVWSVTLGPAKPDIYPYCFIVDGIQVADPNNVLIFTNERFKNSLVDIPGDTPLIHAMQNVPHGRISYINYKSNSLGMIRPLVIYTPAGYDKNSNEKYPVLYLIHGATDTEETWYKVGRINLIMDNLIAQGKVKPMIIVMPYANPSAALAKNYTVTQVNGFSSDIFTTDMVNDIIPFIDSNYRVIAGKENRAIAGFSRGGRQTLAIGLGHPELFSYVCGFAPAVNKTDAEKNFTGLYATPEQLNGLKLLQISCGSEDSLYPSAQGLTETFKAKNIKYQTFFIDGGHTWMNCKFFIAQTAPLLFK
jgi:enterochelin esterase family protein